MINRTFRPEMNEPISNYYVNKNIFVYSNRRRRIYEGPSYFS